MVSNAFVSLNYLFMIPVKLHLKDKQYPVKIHKNSLLKLLFVKLRCLKYIGHIGKQILYWKLIC